VVVFAPVRRTIIGFGLGVAVAVLLAACSSSGSSVPTVSLPAGLGQTPNLGGAGSSGGTLPENLTFSGTLSGTMTSAARTYGPTSLCGFAGGGGDVMLTGSVGGQQVNIVIEVGNYSGPTTYTSQTNAGSIIITVAGASLPSKLSSVTQAYTGTVNSDAMSGTIDADMASVTATTTTPTEHIKGTFSC
jgi:hypothetical protein